MRHNSTQPVVQQQTEAVHAHTLGQSPAQVQAYAQAQAHAQAQAVPHAQEQGLVMDEINVSVGDTTPQTRILL